MKIRTFVFSPFLFVFNFRSNHFLTNKLLHFFPASATSPTIKSTIRNIFSSKNLFRTINNTTNPNEYLFFIDHFTRLWLFFTQNVWRSTKVVLIFDINTLITKIVRWLIHATISKYTTRPKKFNHS